MYAYARLSLTTLYMPRMTPRRIRAVAVAGPPVARCISRDAYALSTGAPSDVTRRFFVPRSNNALCRVAVPGQQQRGRQTARRNIRARQHSRGAHTDAATPALPT